MRTILRHLALACALLGPAAATAQTAAAALTTPPPEEAVLRVAGCTGTLIAPDIVLTAGHCVPQVLRSQPQDPDSCPAMPGHAALASRPGGDPFTWYPSLLQFPVRMGPGPGEGLRDTRRFVEAYALPRCADMALLRLNKPIPANVARPLPVITSVPDPDALQRALIRGDLRHAGFGRPNGESRWEATRRSGHTAYWGMNACALLALPPELELRDPNSETNRARPGDRIVTGDSGAPLLLRLPDGGLAVVAVIWGRNPPDGHVCGVPRPFPPATHGAYTATSRGTLPGTNATDLGAWIATMVPEAAMELP